MTYLRHFALASVLVLVGAGCSLTQGTTGSLDLPTVPPDGASMEAEAETKGDAMMQGDAEASMDAEGEAMMKTGDETTETNEGAMPDEDGEKTSQKPYYIAYSADVAAQATAEGRPVVYYFWASWCPICRAEEPKLKAWIESSEHPIAGFRVNFDTESELKTRYKIPYQHTTVFLNSKGEEVERFLGPVTEAEFRAALDLAAAN